MEWRLLPCDPRRIEAVSAAYNLPPAIARLLVLRGLDDEEAIHTFFSPSLSRLPDPLSIKDMGQAVDRILKAIKDKERIAVFGDYDADGVTATALLIRFLRPFAPHLDFYIPHRVREGYGLSIDALTTLKKSGVSLVITVDCGISNHQELDHAGDLGLEVIVTDHHQISKKGLPPAWAVINPRRVDCPFPFKDLAGVGVAFYLVIALRQAMEQAGLFPEGKPNLKAFLDLVALGTIADVVPLLGVNRILVREGLEVLSRSPQPGLAALKEISGIETEKPLSAYDIAFRLAPRINALGRVDSADDGVRLLLAEALDPARDLARRMDRENTRRQSLEQKMLEEIEEILRRRPELSEKRALVLGSETWHRGVLGLVASKLAERFSKPVFLFSIEGETAHGSGRSVEGFHLFKGLEALDECLIGYGGHEAAAGAALKSQDLALFAEALEDLVRRTLPEGLKDLYLTVEGEVPFSALTREIAPYLPWMAPFGEKNPEPLLVSRGVKILSLRLVGKGHLKVKLEQGGILLEGIAFGRGEEGLKQGDVVDLAYHPFFSNYNGSQKLELRLRDIRPA